MDRSRKLLIQAGAALSVLVIAGAAYWVMRPATPAFHVLSQEQIADYKVTPVERTDASRGLALTKADGPKIRFASPRKDVLASPIDIDVNITPKDGVPVMMSSIRIEYKLGAGWINVTRRIMKYASVSGSRLYAQAADLPKGKHTMRVSVSDQNQRQTQAVLSFVVK